MVPVLDLTAPRPGCGAIWVNSSHEDHLYVREAERSARTVRHFEPGVELVSISDQAHPSLHPVFDHQAVAEFHVPHCLSDKLHYNGQMVAKTASLPLVTWEKNLYLGSDIAVIRPCVGDIFSLLDHFDIVVSHAPVRVNTGPGGTVTDERLQALPSCFPEMNCDLIAYRRSTAVQDFLARWHDTYAHARINHYHDQGAFRYLLLRSDLRVYILPPEYNYRGYDYSDTALIQQRREAIALYAREHPHIASIYDAG